MKQAWSAVAVSVLARAAVDGFRAKRPNGMPRRRWRRAQGPRLAARVRGEVGRLVWIAQRDERRAAARAEWWLP